MKRDFNISTRVYNYWCEMQPHVKAIILLVRILIIELILIIANIAIKQSVKFHKILGLTYPDIKITNITINLKILIIL